MTFIDVANYFGQTEAWVYAALAERGLGFSTQQQQFYIEHPTALYFFQRPFSPKVMVFQILKGGTGKTSIALEFAVRASLYGTRVLCIDLDQQANLTTAFDLNTQADEVPVMVDCLNEGYPLSDSIVMAQPGIDLIPSRIENALLDEIIRNNAYSLDSVYRQPFHSFKNEYDLIVVDCPPSLGQSVAAAALAADLLIAPVTPEKFALSGLQATYQSLSELIDEFGIEIPLRIVLNKFDVENKHSTDTLEWLRHHPQYHDKLLNYCIRLCPSFPNAALESGSIFDSVLASAAKEDMDGLTRRLLGLYPFDEIIAKNSNEQVFVIPSRPWSVGQNIENEL